MVSSIILFQSWTTSALAIAVPNSSAVVTKAYLRIIDFPPNHMHIQCSAVGTGAIPDGYDMGRKGVSYPACMMPQKESTLFPCRQSNLRGRAWCGGNWSGYWKVPVLSTMSAFPDFCGSWW